MGPALRGRSKRAVKIQYTLTAMVWALGAYSMWRATQVDGDSVPNAFTIGLMLQLLAVVGGMHFSRAARDAREYKMESDVQRLRMDLRRVVKQVERLCEDRDDREAAAALRAAVDRADVHQGRRGWVQIVRDDVPGN